MALKQHNTPCGTLYVNDGNNPEVFYVKGEAITLLGRQAKFVGGATTELAQWLRHPELWESRKLYEDLRAKGEKISVLLKVEHIGRWGDNLMLTIVSKAHKEIYEDCISVDVLTTEKFKPVWEGNPHIRTVYTELPKGIFYSTVIDLNAMEMKYRPVQNQKCADQILHKAGLYTVNKTPVYKVLEAERKWARSIFERLSRPIYGVSSHSFAKLKEYPHMDALIKLLRHAGIAHFQLDKRDANGKYEYSFRRMASLIEQCDAIVTNDSVALHLAGALKKRAFGIFGHADGKVICESYEKAVPISGTGCEFQSCWWDVPCFKAATFQAKEPLGPPACLTELKPGAVVNKIINSTKSVRKILIVMLTYDLIGWTKPALESIRTFHDYDIMVVDNASTDGTQEYLTAKGIPFVSKRCGVAAAQNIGFQKFLEGNYDYVLLLNNDIVLHYDTIDSLIRTMEANPELMGLTSTELMNVEPWKIDMEKAPYTGFKIIPDIPTSAYSCTVFRRSVVEKIGLFDEHFTPRYIEDNDYTLRLRIAGGVFAKSHESIYYHAVGAVINAKVEEQRSRDVHWIKNIEYYWEKWGFRPHDVQDLAKVGPENYKGKLVRDLQAYLTKPGSNMPTIRIQCHLAGLGDAIFRSIVARELKRQISDELKVIYSVSFDPKEPNEAKSLERRAIFSTYPYIDKVEAGNLTEADFTLDLTETEFREEWQEVSKHGQIMSARTEIYLNIAGLKTDQLKPDYFVTAKEKEFATQYWRHRVGKKRIVMAKTGSNMLKCWHGMDKLQSLLEAEKYIIVHPNKDEMDFRRLGAIIEQSDLVISPDSGPSNLAGALGIPALTLFSNRNGERFERMFPSMTAVQGACPYGSDRNYCDYKMFCSKTEGPYRPKENGLGEPECFKALSIDSVMEIAKAILK